MPRRSTSMCQYIMAPGITIVLYSSAPQFTTTIQSEENYELLARASVLHTLLTHDVCTALMDDKKARNLLGWTLLSPRL
jgi:hypothetical protein